MPTPWPLIDPVMNDRVPWALEGLSEAPGLDLQGNVGILPALPSLAISRGSGEEAKAGSHFQKTLISGAMGTYLLVMIVNTSTINMTVLTTVLITVTIAGRQAGSAGSGLLPQHA